VAEQTLRCDDARSDERPHEQDRQHERDERWRDESNVGA
jgi:hypothetical protein